MNSSTSFSDVHVRSASWGMLMTNVATLTNESAARQELPSDHNPKSVIRISVLFVTIINSPARFSCLFDFGQLQSDGVQVLVAIKFGSQVGQLGEVCDEVDLVLCKSNCAQTACPTLDT